MKICSRYSMVVYSISMNMLSQFGKEEMFNMGYEWYQFVLPGFEKIMGV